MNSRVAVPKPFRRGDRWYVRVQVPKAMQSRLGRKEYWVSLGTSDKQEAMRLAATVVAEKRTSIAMVYNRLEGVRQTITEFSDEQRQALFREAYANHVGSTPDLIEEFENSRFAALREFADHRQSVVEELIARLRVSRGEHASITVMMLTLCEANGFSVPEDSQAAEDLRTLCVESFIEAKRNEVAKLRGQAVHSNPNPDIVDPTTGRPREYTPLKRLLARPKEKPVSVRRQGFWDGWLPELREDLAHQVIAIMRRICGEASAAFRWSFV